MSSTQKGPVTPFELREEDGSPTGPFCGRACVELGLAFWAWANVSPHPSCLEPQRPTAPGRQHTPLPAPRHQAHGKPFKATERIVPAEGAACQSLQRVENPGNRAPTSPDSTSLGGPKAGGGTSGTMLFISLFLNKSEVSGGTDEVIRKDMSGIKPRASRPRKALGTRALENLRWGLFILYSESAGLGPGCWTSMSPSPLQPVPSEPLGNSGVRSTF